VETKPNRSLTEIDRFNDTTYPDIVISVDEFSKTHYRPESIVISLLGQLERLT